MNAYSNANHHYLTQRVVSAGPEQMVVLLLEGAQRFVLQASHAIHRRDFEAKAQAINKTLAILDELGRRLDHEQGGELAGNLLRLYRWWGNEMLEAGFKLDTSRLERVSGQMAEMRQTWEQAARPRTGAPGASAFHGGELVG